MKVLNNFYSNTSKYLSIAPTKINKIINKIRNKTYLESLKIFKKYSQKSSQIIAKTIHSAASNSKCLKSSLCIAEIFVNQGSIFKRIRARAKGRAFPIQKKLSHLKVFLSKI
jgi:large subunit ribosomal protein L22